MKTKEKTELAPTARALSRQQRMLIREMIKSHYRGAPIRLIKVPRNSEGKVKIVIYNHTVRPTPLPEIPKIGYPIEIQFEYVPPSVAGVGRIFKKGRDS